MLMSRWSYIALAITVVASSARGQSVGRTEKLTASEAAKQVSKAGDLDLIVSDLKARLRGSRLFFDVEFSKNEANRPWLFRLNLSAAELKEFEEEATEKGYSESLETSVRTRSGRLYSVVWIKRESTPVTLVLPDGPVPESGTTEDRFAPLDDMVRSFVQEHNAAGCSIAVSKSGELVYSRGFGYADTQTQRSMQPNTPMRIASISKPMTAAAAMILVQQGKVALADRVIPILKRDGFQIPSKQFDERWSEITVGHLIRHLGGWDRSVSSDPMFQSVKISRAFRLQKPITPRDVVRYQLRQPLDFDPGSKFVYSNFGYALLGRVIEIIADRTYLEVLTDLVTTPCGMTSSRPGRTRLSELTDDEARYHMQNEERSVSVWNALDSKSDRINETVPEPYGRWLLELMDAGGGWVSTAPDLVRFANCLDASTGRLFTSETLTQIVAEPKFQSEGDNSWYGCGWQVRRAGHSEDVLGNYNLWHTGALAGTSTILVRRHDGFVWAVLFNTDRSPNGQRLSGLIDSRMHRAVNAVHW